jgi:poly(A) polymerase
MQEDFFVVLCNMLKSRPEVSEIHCVKDAKVPLMRFKFDGISVDLPFAQLQVLSVPEVSAETMQPLTLDAYQCYLQKHFIHFQISISNFFF